MIRSMTGYGRRESAWSGRSLSVEVRSVNHRFCEIVSRLPRSLAGLEEDLKKAIQRRCQRGRIELTVSLSGGVEGEKKLSLDRSLAKQYHRLLRELQQELRLGGVIDLSLLSGFRDIVAVSEQPLATAGLKQTVKRLLAGALEDLDAMRRREGQALARDTKHRLLIIREEVEAMTARAPLVVRGLFDRMAERIQKLVGAGPIDQGRLSQELAEYADRCDVSEELTRLDSHLVQFDGALASKEPVGRTMDFLLQEMGREVNTIGSKANDAEMAVHVVRIKGELEKIREQAQNIE
jgi:uncharacterized protein (TIGR00255 family)